ncbi:MAG: hypothetical protein LC777_12565 [Actinobacteria bacterium]|nr:hypothetical protein [Actinomycetota bacterium]
MSRPASRGWMRPALVTVWAALGAGGCGGAQSPTPSTTAGSTSTTPPARAGGTAPPPAAAGRTSTVPPARSGGSDTSTSTTCTDGTCTVRATCDGAIHVRSGTGPVKTRSSSTGDRTTIVLDFVGSARDAVIRC